MRAAYLASPPLVVALALAGNVAIDPTRDPIGLDRDGAKVHLAEIWPTDSEVAAAVASAADPMLYSASYAALFEGDARWQALEVPSGRTYTWSADSTYVARPEFTQGIGREPVPIADITEARALLLLGDSVTTDHISPAGVIRADSPAGRWLQERGVVPSEFNSYGARRGHDQVMARGTFANTRLRNALADGREGPFTRYAPSGAVLPVYDAAAAYARDNTPLIVLAGREYGSGSSRDWAAKGTRMLGVRAVIAESFERIHRSNLIGMGILPLQFLPGESAATLSLNGRERYSIAGLADLTPRARVRIDVLDEEASRRSFEATLRLDGPIEVETYRQGGIMPAVLRRIARSG